MTDEPNPHSLPTEWGFEVYRTESDRVAIRQDAGGGPYDDEEPVVVIAPERVDALIGFLRAVKDQILTDRADDAEGRVRAAVPPPLNG